MQGRTIGISKTHFDALGLQIHPHARHGPARARRTNEAIELALCLRPDLRPGGLYMRLAIGCVVKLIGPYGAIGLCFGQFLRQTPRVAHIIIGIFIGGGGNFDKLRTGKSQHILFLLALRFRDDDHRAKPHGGTDQRQANPGVARRALHDRAPRP